MVTCELINVDLLYCGNYVTVSVPIKGLLKYV